MKITVLNGSPKGDVSVTMQYVKWLSKQFPQHDYQILNIAAQISQIEREEESFKIVLDAVEVSDVVLWSYPLYIMLVHSNYKRFIELIFERNAQDVFRGKCAAQLATSIHFFDHTALAYINGICDDLGMRYLGAFSAEMDDLKCLEKREALCAFMKCIEVGVLNGVNPTRNYATPVNQAIVYQPGIVADRQALNNKRAVILIDGYDPNTNLGRMVDAFRNRLEEPVELIDLDEIPMKGGCLGCIHCGFDNECIYGDSDGVIPLYERLRTYDIIVYALTIRDRYFSARWKQFVDRQFYRTHQPTFETARMAYLISGPLQQLPMLREIIDGGAQFDSAGLIGIATDEADTSDGIDRNIDALCRSLAFYATNDVKLPQTFLAIGGIKLFRDEMWGHLRPVFQADHRYYKSHGIYDFPQKDYGVRLRNLLVTPILKLPSAKRWFQKNMKENMVRTFKQF